MRTPIILIVDDEAHVRYIVELKLREAGYNVIVATNGRQAFELTARERPDLVVTDFQMPGEDGLELAIRLAEQPTTRDVPLLMLTARGHRVDAATLARTNIRAMLAKPFSPRDLVTRVHEVLDEVAAGGRGAAA